jgi:hypothetical protein
MDHDFLTMLFLIEYDRKSGRLVTLKHFSDEQRDEANGARLDLELQQLGRLARAHEIVVLEAADEDALRRTHRRYFERLDGPIRSAIVL